MCCGRNLVAACLALAVLTSGCVGLDLGGEDHGPSIDRPTWEPGMFWIYAFETPDIEDHDVGAVRMVVARAEGENWLVGASTVTDARLHGVLNFNPMLGRIRLTDLAVYEKGKPQPILRFPLTKGDAWTFSLFDVETWEARVTSVRDQDVLGEATRIAYIEAEGSDGARLEYQFDSRAGWLRSLVYWTPDGEMSITMTLVSYGTGWEGRVYFVRGRDLYDGSYESTLATPIADVFDTFVDQGHPKYGDFTYLIYFTNYDISGDGEGAWILRDHTGTSQASSFYDPNTAGTELGTAPSVSGNWTLSLELTGNSYFRIRVAGGIEYSWKVEV